MSRRRRLLAAAALAAVVVAFLTWQGVVGGALLRGAVAWGLQRVPRDPALGGELCPAPKSGPTVVMVVGSDSRADLPVPDGPEFGALTGEQADMVALVAIDQDAGQVRWLDVPRNLRVTSPRWGDLALSQALGTDGRAALVRLVRGALGVAVHHYIEVDFAGLARLVDAVGGVDVDFPRPARDVESGLFVDAGRQRLDGRMALAYARSRHYQERAHVYWLDADSSPDARRMRQEQLVLALLDRVRTRVRPLELYRLAPAVPGSVVADPGLDTVAGMTMVRSARSAVFEFRGLPTAEVVGVDELVSPFGSYFGGGLYLEPGPGAPSEVEWLAGDTAACGR